MTRPAAVPRWGSPELADPALKCMVWVAVWCKMTGATRVVHWGLMRGSGVAGAWSSAVEAALR